MTMKKKPPLPPSSKGSAKAGALRSGLLGALRSDWRSIARVEQLPPPGEWTTWIFCAGRGSGKTRSGAEWIQERAEAGLAKRIHLIAPTAADARDVMLEGPAGLLSVASSNMRPTYLPSLRKVEWPNGAQALLFSSDEPDRLRGPQCDTLWIDELCAMARAQEVLDMSMLGLRLSKDPKCLITTTPRPIKPFKKLVERDGQDVVITRCSTMANAENLARPFLSQILQQYQGTRLGRQELNAELLLDVPGALWTLAMLENTRVVEAPQSFQRIVIGVDPAGSSSEFADQTGIVVCALGHDGHVYVLADASGNYTPSQWAQVVVDLYYRHRADRICVEKNFGGDMVEATIRTADPSVAIKAVTSSRGKVLRAEPIAAFWEQKRAHIVGSLPALEDQLTNFSHSYDRARDGSPDRLDAAVFALTELTGNQQGGGYFSSSLLLANGEPVAIPAKSIGQIVAVASTPSKSGDQLGVVFLLVDEHRATSPWPMIIVDWDLRPVDDGLFQKFVPGIFARLAALSRMCQCVNGGLWVHGTSGVSASVLQWATERGHLVHDIDTEVEWAAAPLDARATAAARHLHTGRHVKIGKEAHEKTVEFRSHTRNHLVAEYTAFKIGEDLPADALLRALLSGTLIALDASRASAEDAEDPAPPPAPRAPPVPPPPPHILLPPGKHTIDGASVDVPKDGDKDLVMVELSVGRHLINSRITYVSRAE
jgi:phage terminase large subunit-like protein